MTTILIKKKDTAGAPAAGDLTNAAGGAEIAVNTATKRIYTKDSGGNVVEVGTNPTATTMNGNLTFVPDATYDIGASGATRPRDVFLSRNLNVGGTMTVAGGINFNGNVTVGDSSADTLTINSTITSNLIFTDNTYDIGASGATRPRNLFLAGNATIGGAQTLAGALTVNTLTATRVPYASTSGLLVDSANMTFNGTRLTVADLADSGLSSGRVVYAGSGGALTDSANLTFSGQTLSVTNNGAATGPTVPSYALAAVGNTNLAFAFTATGETYTAGTASSKFEYVNSGTLGIVTANTTTVNSGALIDFNAYNSSGGATNIYIGAVAGSVAGGGPANFVVGRRTGVASWAESLRVDTNGYVLVNTNTNSGFNEQMIVNSPATVGQFAINSQLTYNCSVSHYINRVAQWYTQALGDGSQAYRFYNAVAGSEAARIDSNNNLLIGTTAGALGRLYVVGGASSAGYMTSSSGTTQQAILTLSNGTNGAYISVAGVGTSSAVPTWANGSIVSEAVPFSSGNYILSAYSGALVFQTGGRNERARFVSTGEFVIGGTSAPRLLTLSGSGASISVNDINGGIYFGTGGSGGGGFASNCAIARAAVAGYHIGGSSVGDLCIGPTAGSAILFGYGASGAVSLNEAMKIASTGVVSTAGNLSVGGALSKGSGSFRIEHPLPQLAPTHQLVHSFIEGPQADLIYRGKVNLVGGIATVNIDTAAGMTEGTFVVLCRDVQCFTTNESDWTAVRGSVSGNILTIEAQDQTSASSISWMVIGERQDKHMYDTDWTDDNGKVIVEPLKPIEA
jgi:hypothetical protein